MKKVLVISALALVILVAGFFILNNYIYNEKQDPTPPATVTSFDDCVRAGNPVLDSNPEQCETEEGVRFVDDAQSTAVLTGTFVCLPHRDTSGPTTLECAFGLRTDSGAYYALRDPDPSHSTIGDISVDTRVRASGELALEESTTYKSIGTLEVREILEQ